MLKSYEIILKLYNSVQMQYLKQKDFSNLQLKSMHWNISAIINIALSCGHTFVRAKFTVSLKFENTGYK